MTVQACAALVQKGDPDRFLATMAAPPDARALLFPLYAFNLEVARAPWVTAEPMIAAMRLQFWRDTLADIADGTPPRAHEVAEPLAGVIRDRALDIAPLDALVTARHWDIETNAFADRAAFDAHIDATAGNLMWVAAQTLGARKGEGIIRDVAYASGVANWLVAAAELEARGRMPLVDGRPDGIAALAADALKRLKLAQGRRGDIPRAATPALRAGWRAERVLKQALRDSSRVAEGTLGESEFTRRWGLLRRTLTGRW